MKFNILYTYLVQQVSPHGLILVQQEMPMMYQMIVIQLQQKGKKMMMRKTMKISMMPTMMNLLVMVALCLAKILMIKMMRRQMQFMKLLMNAWMKKEENTERRG